MGSAARGRSPGDGGSRYRPALLCLVLNIACSTAPPSDTRPKTATLVLADGETIAGVIQNQTENTISFLTVNGVVRSIPVKDVLLVQSAAEPAATAQVAVAAPAAPQPPGTLEKFQPPVSGTLALAAGTAIPLAPNSGIDSGSVFPHLVLTGEITADLPSRPVAIPSGSSVTLEVLEAPMRGRGEIVLGLAAININGHLFRVVGEKSARLGALPDPDAGKPDTGKAPARGIHVATGTVLTWKLAQALVLKEEK